LEFSSSPPSGDDTDFWQGIFGDIYVAYYRQMIYTAGPIVSELQWMINTFNPMSYVLSMFNTFNYWFIGFNATCLTHMFNANSKVVRALMRGVEYMLWLVLVVVRFFSLLVYAMFYLCFVIMDFFSDIIVGIN
jgi:hypothetical protein